MSELEKAIDQKLADARKASEGAESESQKVVEVKIKKEPGTEGDGDKKKVEEGGKGKEDPKSKKEEPPKKVASGSASSKKDEPKKGADEKKDGQSSRSGGDRKDDSRKVSSSGDSRRTSGSDRRDDHRRGNDRRDDSSRSYRSRKEDDDRRRGTSNRDRDEPSRNGTKSSRGEDGKKDSKPNEKKDSKPEEKKDEIKDKTKDDKSKDSDKVDAQSEDKKDPEQPEGTPTEGAAAKPKKKKNKRPKVTINDGVEWDITRDFGTSTDDIGAVAVKQEPPEEWQVLSEDHENDKEPSEEKETRTSPEKEKRNSQEKEKQTSKDKDKPSSKDKEKRGRDRSPTPPWSTRHKSVRGRGNNRYQSDRRSPPRRRSRSREVSRRRSRSPVRNRSRSPRYRRSPSTYARSYRAPSRRYSPPRRSRSPARRRSRSRSRISSDRGANPKALLAKKSFLDDLAVKFAQEGKEFPELEQYRCEINSQFGSGSSYMPRSLEHVPGCGVGAYAPPPPPGMGMSMGLGGGSMYDMPYSMGAPEYVESPPLVGYPIASPAPAKPSPPMMTPLEDIMATMKGGPSSSIETIMPENQVAVSDLLISQTSNLGSQPEPALEKGFVWRGDVKTRVSQAIELLDDMELAIQRSGKFMYRSQTYYENNIDENRSPMLQGPNNPRYAFNAPPGESNDPFGNIPKNIKPVIKTLCLDEGRISEHIFLRTRKQQLAATLKKKKQEMDERKKRAMASNVPKAQLQKTTQTDPTVCTECLIRKLKFRATAETQTAPILTTDSVVQTNPMPVQTVSEFGSITELTPNQVRAVSELIRYIKLTATTGSVEEMRNSMLTNQMYSVNSDLRNAYQYFDAMVEHKNNRIVPAPPSAAPQQILEAIDEPPIEDIIYEDDNDGTNEENWDDEVDDEYEKYHKTFGGDSEHAAAGGGRGQMFGQPPSSAPTQYQDPKSSFQNNPLAPYSYTGTMQHAGGGLRGRGGGPAAVGRGKFIQPRGGRGRGGGKKNARGGKPKPANWK